MSTYSLWNQLSGFAVFVFIVIQIIWLVSLVRVIKNPNLSDIQRFMWVFIVIMLNILGSLLYAILAPSYLAKKTGQALGSFFSGDLGTSPAEFERRKQTR